MIHATGLSLFCLATEIFQNSFYAVESVIERAEKKTSKINEEGERGKIHFIAGHKRPNVNGKNKGGNHGSAGEGEPEEAREGGG